MTATVEGLWWAGISVNLRTKLYIVNGNFNSQRYINEILRPLVLPFLQQIGPNAVFQDDNAWSHRGRIVNDFVRTNNINRMDWPANSPDLNPIEHKGNNKITELRTIFQRENQNS